ncbi:Na+/H+ antiporter subunit E [Aromatoleum diolicum]|uniref:Na+/H+ antiporter subunit E n=1 Tax=Aromatoleum diolicum TaxID=75796 RepID=A0ABX1Q4S1_9RHOO|nr:Na+/H+ antiporter subunit E [Aromatoleum diolicum]NMG73278.1 Na+/H+ antiporter subunit E [Aromatoleum diolicum]
MMLRDSRDSFAARWLPHPVLSIVLTAMWVLLLNSVTVGGVLLGIALGVVIPAITIRFWPRRPPLRSYRKVAAYVLLVMWDILVANVHVAWLILFRPVSKLRTRWVCVPLDLESPEAITVFAGTITMTPGTVSCDLAADGRCLLVHCLDAPDAELAVQEMKARYEARLKEIFQ